METDLKQLVRTVKILQNQIGKHQKKLDLLEVNNGISSLAPVIQDMIRTDKQKGVIQKINSSFIANLTEEQIDTYISNNITTLATAKTFLQKLSKVVLCLLKQTNLQ